ncbi:alpha-latroinsectotoxin-Lt1a-like [Hordeum vulgare subsp. vulgare]|uniref:PGG domain-containing protein n=1 Tax=Hordeum vulgare subsp. vulgare TaxID=112509 RepID=A0A8I7B0B9_HORVV|nr:alpha-latroinsectotoxin-Lt1a-like [Hordeum vulgare subsp. vulgare]
MEEVDPMLAMASSTGVVASSSPNALAVGLWDAQQLEVMSLINPINPLLLASACVGSSEALVFLFRREDNQEPPMLIPTQDFLDLLEGYTPGSSTRRSPSVPQAYANVEDGVDQPFFRSTSRLLAGVTAEGDTALHAVTCHGDTAEFQECARIINERDQRLLFAVNRKGDTPLHCAARAGRSRVLSCLIKLAASCNRLHELLRKENGLKETALHDALRIGRKDIVESLMEADPELANYPKDGTSPLYLAILLSKCSLPETLHDKSNGNLSYAGPNGQNALHAAISQDTVITKHVLNWNNSLTTRPDRDGSTPLHFVSSFWHWPAGVKQLLEANPLSVYQEDNNGLFPIHVAASMGVEHTITIILEMFPSCAGLRTARGQTFLHVAIQKRRKNIVSFVCRTPSLNWILNMRDNDGNTALHLAAQARNLCNFCSVFANKKVQLNIANNNNQTALDISRSVLPDGTYYSLDNGDLIRKALEVVHAKDSCLRQDLEEKYSRKLIPNHMIIEAEKVRDSSQMLGLGSVLIATVTFGATFAVPGGFVADDHTNKGTPTLAGRYAFDAFMMANALAFICSSIATIGLVYSGISMVNLRIRIMNFNASVVFMSSSVTSLSAAFALGVYMVLAPVANSTGIAICVLSPLVVLYRNFEFLLKADILARPICVRIGLSRGLKWLALIIGGQIFVELWPFIFIFGWAAIAQKLENHP